MCAQGCRGNYFFGSKVRGDVKLPPSRKRTKRSRRMRFFLQS
jgi:hypothetical protein